MQTALSAAETGHLVLSTVHTVDATESINRLLEFFPPHQHSQARAMIAGTIKGVVSQRLVPGAAGGRVACCEILRMTGRVRDMIMDPAQTGKLHEVIADGEYYGMQTFDQHLFAHLKAGRVTIEDAMKTASSPHDFKLLVAADGRRRTSMEDVDAAAAKRPEFVHPDGKTASGQPGGRPARPAAATGPTGRAPARAAAAAPAPAGLVGLQPAARAPGRRAANAAAVVTAMVYRLAVPTERMTAVLRAMSEADGSDASVIDRVCGAAERLVLVTGAGLSLMVDGELRGTAGPPVRGSRSCRTSNWSSARARAWTRGRAWSRCSSRTWPRRASCAGRPSRPPRPPPGCGRVRLPVAAGRDPDRGAGAVPRSSG